MIEIILALLALLGNCGWFVSGRKHRAEANRENFDLSVQYVNEFKTNVYEPLCQEVKKLRQAIESINTCEHRSNCPVADRLRNHKSE